MPDWGLVSRWSSWANFRSRMSRRRRRLRPIRPTRARTRCWEHLCLRSGEFGVSIESLYTAVKFNNREALAIAGLAEVEYFENRSRNAYEALNRAIQLDPTEP